MFEHTKCPVCGKPFAQNDDIVVCPVCGTPHHRDCYLQNGTCHNTNLHDSGFVFQEKTEEADAKGMVCPRCNTNNPDGSSFCLRCGMKLDSTIPLNPQQNMGQQLPYTLPFFNQPPNIDMEEEIDGVKVKYLSNYIKSNFLYYILKFKKMTESESIFSWNWGAFVSPFVYFFYRKMWLLGIVSFFVMVLNSFPAIISMILENGLQLPGFPDFLLSQSTLANIQNYGTIISFAFYFFSGSFANYFYKRKAYKAVHSALYDGDSGENEQAVIQKLSHTGGVSPIAVMTVMTLLFASYMIFVYFFAQ